MQVRLKDPQQAPKTRFALNMLGSVFVLGLGLGALFVKAQGGYSEPSGSADSHPQQPHPQGNPQYQAPYAADYQYGPYPQSFFPQGYQYPYAASHGQYYPQVAPLPGYDPYGRLGQPEAKSSP